MSLVSRVTGFATAVGTDIKSLLSGQGELASLATAEKASLVGAINELKATTPRITVGTTAPASPAVGDLWVDMN